MITTTKDACSVFQIHKSTLTAWKRAGAPGYLSRDRWDLAQLIPWWAEHIFQGSSTDDATLSDIKREYWTARAERERLTVEQQKGELVPKDQAEDWLIQVITEAKTVLLAIPRRMAMTLSAVDDPRGIEDALRAEIHRALNKLAKGGK